MIVICRNTDKSIISLFQILITNNQKKKCFFHPTFDEAFLVWGGGFCQSRVYHSAKNFSITKKWNKKFYDLMKICLELKTCGGWDEMYIKYVIILFGDILVLDLSLKFFFFWYFFVCFFSCKKKNICFSLF